MSNEVIISIDIETDGPSPSANSMIALGAVAFSGDGKELGDFYANIRPQLGHYPDADTSKWWDKQFEKFPKLRELMSTPAPEKAYDALIRFEAWFLSFGLKPVALTYPTWDFAWVFYYLHRFLGRCKLGINSLDAKSYAWAILGGESFGQITKKNMPKWWFGAGLRNPHFALEDARVQGQMFFEMQATCRVCGHTAKHDSLLFPTDQRCDFGECTCKTRVLAVHTSSGGS